MKFEEDFDFETANAQFHKDDIDKELQSKLKLKGKMAFCSMHTGSNVRVCLFRQFFCFRTVSFIIPRSSVLIRLIKLYSILIVILLFYD